MASPESPSDVAVQAYLEGVGFHARSASEWAGEVPTLRVKVADHSKVGKHTFYRLDCKISMRGLCGVSTAQEVPWECNVRLKHLRRLHDTVKRDLGTAYRGHFTGMHFAHRMRPMGTTARLDSWCRRLAHCVSVRLLSPAAAAQALRVLQAPPLHRDAVGADVLAGAADVAGDVRTSDEGSSDSDLDEMLAGLSSAESAFGLGEDATAWRLPPVALEAEAPMIAPDAPSYSS
eukprot:CAMPEP_0198500336 /NCGR_PEP_ID=MMETSP1462-20131121/8111_1 /TAXON_ID=1333877 /ORGANISM="Brandtodinium nutriculum, Strain RCC3387" /LENGTH=231 /DNA_ID=CAMNT_0044229345 /DNA_START=150 /DNA_END=841 /DNA_ORIENTATION=+